MTTLTQLIEHYCPNGVEYVKLGDVATVKAGSPVSKQKIAESAGIYPVINSGREPLGFIAEFNSTDPIGITTRGAGVGFVSWTEGPHFKGNLNYNVKVNSHIVSDRFLFFTLKEHGDSIRDLCSFAGIPALNLKSIKTLVFPLPPREVQDAIVERLDAFAALIESLDSEITLREKRFEHFREQLLTFVDSAGVEYVKLGDVAIRQRGIAITAAKMRELDSPDGDIVVFGAGATRALVNSSEIASANIHTKDSVIVKARGHVGFEMCTVPFATKSELWSYRSDDPRLNIRYSYYFLSEHSGELAEIARLNGVKLPQLKVSDTDDYLIPLPSLDIQHDIVDKLDTMQALIDNLKQERELRQAQFEYYREKLLTFNS